MEKRDLSAAAALMFAAVILVGVVYILMRSLGKYVGSYISCSATKCDPLVKKYGFEGDIQVGANIAGFEKVCDAMLWEGISY